jgi:hypothetical protein
VLIGAISGKKNPVARILQDIFTNPSTRKKP